MHKIGIIDHVGNKSGMDIYDISLSSKLSLNIKVYLLSNFEDNSKCTKQLKICKLFNTDLEGNSVIGKVKYFFKGFYSSFKYLKNKKCTDVILHSFSFEYKDLIVCLLAKIMGFRTFLIVHDVSGFAKKDSGFVKDIILNKLATKILVHNKFSKKAIISEINNPNKIITIRHGGYIEYVNSNITKTEAFSKLNLDPNYRYFLFFGQIKEVKGLDLLIEAFSKLKNKKVKLIIAGKPWKDDFSKYEKQILYYNLKKRVILFKKFVPDPEKDLLFAATDAIVIPYRKIFQSGVLLTALSYPKIVVCSNLDPNKEVIKNKKNGYLFESGNVDSLVNVLDELLEQDKKVIDILKNNALNTVIKEYNWDYPAKVIFDNL